MSEQLSEPIICVRTFQSPSVILQDRSLGGVWLVCHALLRVFQPPMLGLLCGFGVLVWVQFFRATAQSRCCAACALSCLCQVRLGCLCFVSASEVLECR